jgi:hypothetical protein
MTAYNMECLFHIRRIDATHYSSDETTRDRITGDIKPMLELTDLGNRVLCVSFVRPGTGPAFTLTALLDAAEAWARAHTYTRIELEDDALFPIPCPHRALYRRAFEGKPGIYESKGWRPLRDTGPFIATIMLYTRAQARELQDIIREVCRKRGRGPQSPHTPNLSTASVNDVTPFGVWINSQSPPVMRQLYNVLLILSAGRFKNKIDKLTLESKAFLEALHGLQMANKVLYKTVI